MNHLFTYNSVSSLVSQKNLQIGDILIRSKGGIFTKHHAVFLGYQESIGTYAVAENQVNFGVHIISLQEFLNQGHLEEVIYFKGNENLVIDRVNRRLGEPYNLMSYNCEHFVNEVTRGNRHSKQVQTFGLFSAAAAVLGISLLLSK